MADEKRNDVVALYVAVYGDRDDADSDNGSLPRLYVDDISGSVLVTSLP